MLSKNKFKLIRSLASKKTRIETGLFIAEGEKLVSELLNSVFEVLYVIGTEEWFQVNPDLHFIHNIEKFVLDQKELNKLSSLKTPQNVICVVKIPEYKLNFSDLKNKLSLMLDTIQDPGNLGTILRIADWFGIDNVICTQSTVDLYNPKVVQATMGSISRVKVYYEDFGKTIPVIKSLGLPVYGTTLNGENIYEASLNNYGIIMMGNESKGIDKKWQQILDRRLFIPFYPIDRQRPESLNVATATAIICSEFRRRR
jgi:RNA methyltransferase, TrmH family